MASETHTDMSRRKETHLSLCLEAAVETNDSGFADYSLRPAALPELSLSEIDTTRVFLGRSFSLPIFIAGMTGGVQRAQEFNEVLAIAAQEANIPFGLGSQKIMVREPSMRRLFDVRKAAPQVFLMGNLGAADLNAGISCDDVLRLVDSLKLDAFAFHLNALQECIQPEGSTDFRNVISALENVVKRVGIPVIVKEVGGGISSDDYRRLADIGVAAVDVGGRGGTSWSLIEGYRGDDMGNRLGQLFSTWGLRTAEAVAQCARARVSCENQPDVLATGGIRDGVQAAKAVALGASMCGVGLPFLKAASAAEGPHAAHEGVLREIDFFARSLRIAMFCSGSASLSKLGFALRARTGCGC
jgi:isopentenyl-diphosphate delta-isomerase